MLHLAKSLFSCSSRHGKSGAAGVLPSPGNVPPIFSLASLQSHFDAVKSGPSLCHEYFVRVLSHDPGRNSCSPVSSGVWPCRILISGARKPTSYINIAHRLLSEHGVVHLTALGTAISSMVTVAEILKSRQLAVVSKLKTSMEDVTEDQRRVRSVPDQCARVFSGKVRGMLGLPHRPVGTSACSAGAEAIKRIRLQAIWTDQDGHHSCKVCSL